MGTESRQVRQDAFLCPCPHCAADNALNAARCWRCEEQLPPPSADAIVAAYAALAVVREGRWIAPPRLPEGWRLYSGSRAAPRKRALVAARGGAADPSSLPPTSAPVPADDTGPPFLRTIAMGDEDDDEAEATVVEPSVKPRFPVPDSDDGEATAFARRVAVTERFGAFAERAEAASRRRHVFGLAAAVLGTVLILAGYPIYRSAERSLGVGDLRRAPPPPGWPQTPAVAPQRAPSTVPLMTREAPLASPMPQTAAVRAAVVDTGAPLQAVPAAAIDTRAPLQAAPTPEGRGERLAPGGPVRTLAGPPLHRTPPSPQRVNPPAGPHGVDAAGTAPVSLSARGEHLPRVARADRSTRRRTAQPLILPPATTREIAALAAGR